MACPDESSWTLMLGGTGVLDSAKHRRAYLYVGTSLGSRYNIIVILPRV